jgi:hypothetical protein
MASRRGALVWFVTALALYALSAARGPMWADSSKLTLYALHGYTPSLNPGDHPGWTLCAEIWLTLTRWLPAAQSLALFSAFAAALSVALVFVLVLRRGATAAQAHSAACVLLVLHPHWWAAATAETYSLTSALVLAAAVATTSARARLGALAAGVASGLALATHFFAIFLLAPFLPGLKHRAWLPAALGLLLGCAPVWLAVAGVPADPLTGHFAAGPASWHWAFATFLAPSRIPLGLLTLIAMLLFGFGVVALAGVFAGRTHPESWHPSPRVATAALVVLALVLATYSTFRLHLMAGFVGLGLILLWPPLLSRRARCAHIAVQVSLYLLTPLALQLAGRADLGVRQLPERDNAWYFLCPIKSLDQGPARYARDLLQAAPRNATVLADFNPGAVLRLVQESERLRPDVKIVPTAVDEALAAPDPARALARSLRAAQARQRPTVLADRWEPYYRIAALHALGFALTDCGPGLLVSEAGERRASSASSASPPPVP